MAMLRSKLVDQETQGEMPVTVFAEKGTIRVNGPASLLAEIVLANGDIILYDFTHVDGEVSDADLESEPEWAQEV
jgi:hypothetical protein